jgi:hypothetical protein
VDDRHFGYNIELATKDTASRTLLVTESGELVGPVVECFDDALSLFAVQVQKMVMTVGSKIWKE